MGIFSSKNFKSLTGGSFIGKVGTSGWAGDPFGARAAAEGLRDAGSLEEQLRQEALGFKGQIEEETSPFRALAREQIPFLREEAGAAPGTSPLYQQTLTRGVTDIQGQLAARGLSDSSTSAQAISGFGSQLAAQDISRLTGLRQGLAGLGTYGFGEQFGAQQLASNIGLQRAQTLAGIGAAKGAGRQATTQAVLDIGGKIAGGLA